MQEGGKHDFEWEIEAMSLTIAINVGQRFYKVNRGQPRPGIFFTQDRGCTFLLRRDKIPVADEVDRLSSSSFFALYHHSLFTRVWPNVDDLPVNKLR